MPVFQNANYIAINTEVNISQLQAKTPQTHGQPTCSGLFGRVSVDFFCRSYFFIIIFKGFFPSHLQLNRHEDHSLLMPLSHDPELLVLPIHKKFPAGREFHPQHDAIAAFVHLSSMGSNLPVCIPLLQMARIVANERASCWERRSSLPISIWTITRRPACEP